MTEAIACTHHYHDATYATAATAAPVARQVCEPVYEEHYHASYLIAPEQTVSAPVRASAPCAPAHYHDTAITVPASTFGTRPVRIAYFTSGHYHASNIAASTPWIGGFANETVSVDTLVIDLRATLAEMQNAIRQDAVNASARAA